MVSEGLRTQGFECDGFRDAERTAAAFDAGASEIILLTPVQSATYRVQSERWPGGEASQLATGDR
jgi:hypothetical protein